MALPVTRPKNIQWLPTGTFGIPRGTPGRAGFAIAGIVLHCLGETLAQYDGIVCETPKINRAKRNHASLHYAVGYEGELHQYVEDTNIAWGFGAYLGNFPGAFPVSGINWPPLTTAPPTAGSTPDYYVLNIGLESGIPRTESACEVCAGATVLDTQGYAQLVHLLSYLAATYSIPITAQHITFDQTINPLAEDECVCADLTQLLADVAAYCEPCASQAPTAPVGTAAYVLGRTAPNCADDNGCVVWQDVSALPSVAINWCAAGATIPVGTIATGFTGIDANGCLVSDIIHTDATIGGTGTAGDPLTVVPVTPTDVLAQLCAVPASTAPPTLLFGAADATCPVAFTPAQVVESGLSVQPSPCLDLTLTGGVLSAAPVLSGAQNGVSNVIACTLDGLYIPRGANAQTGGALTGDGSETAPLALDFSQLTLTDLCALGSVIPSGAIANIIGVTAGGCLAVGALPAQTDVCTTIASLPDGANGGVGVAGNTRVVGADCRLYTLPVASFDLCGAIAAMPAGGNGGVGVAGETVVVGVDCRRYLLPAEVPFVANSTASIAATSGGTAGHSPTYDVRVAPGANALQATSNGLYVAPETLNVSDTPSVDLTYVGGSNILAASVKLDPSIYNDIVLNPSGLFVNKQATLVPTRDEVNVAPGAIVAGSILYSLSRTLINTTNRTIQGYRTCAYGSVALTMPAGSSALLVGEFSSDGGATWSITNAVSFENDSAGVRSVVRVIGSDTLPIQAQLAPAASTPRAMRVRVVSTSPGITATQAGGILAMWAQTA